MCITADADNTVSDEVVLSETALEDEEKVVSVDVDKVGILYSAVPKGYHGVTEGGNNGRVRLLNYFKEIERRIATEVSGRKMDITKIKQKMARNRAYNAKARSKMKKMLLTKMAQNAKKAKDDLATAMAKTARTFAKQAAINNRRFKQTVARSRKTREIMAKNKRKANHDLHTATSNQQAALAALDQQMNTKIKKTNKHIAANAAAIKLNAKKARDALDQAKRDFNKKLFDDKNDAKEGRSQLAARAKSMDKKTRAMISGLVSAEATKTAAEFDKVRKKMADDRHHADMGLKHATTSFTAALAASKALQDKRFTQTVADIKAAKAEAAALVKKATEGFKVNLLQLASTVKHQVTLLNGKVTQLQGVVTKNKVEQANVNRHVTAEMKRMVALGHKREATLAKGDKSLHDLMDKNHNLNTRHMLQMANKFNQGLADIRKQMKKDRANSERNLNKQTASLYATLAKNEKIQGKVNKKLAQATTRARLDAEDALREAKRGFGKKLASMHATIVANDKKADKKIKELTGVVDANAVKDAAGRKALKVIQASNKQELQTAVRNAVHKGEMRALQVEKHAKAMNEKTRSAMNMRITNEIGVLTTHIHASVEDLRLSTKEARKEMKREILYSVRSAAADAKSNLAKTVKWANTQFQGLDENLEKEEKKSGAALASFKENIESEKKKAGRALVDAVANQNRALLALQSVTQKKIKKTNRQVDAYGKRIEAHAKAVTKQMGANILALNNKIDSARKKVKGQLTAANKKSIARKENALKFISSSLKVAEKAADKKFGTLYVDLGKDRAHFDDKVAATALEIQAAIAKRSALYDSRFRKTVKDLDLAKKLAYLAVVESRKAFTSSIVGITASIKDQETRLTGEIAIVGTEVAGHKQQQTAVNRRVDGEMKRILSLADTRAKEARKERGSIRRVIDEHKAVAAKERASLAKSTQTQLRKMRSKMAAARREAAEDLTKATKGLYGAVAQAETDQKKEFKHLKGALAKASLTVAAKKLRAEKEFTAKMTTLTNVVNANSVKYEVGLNEITGVAHDWKLVSGNERKLLKDQIASMEKDLNKAIIKAVQIGEAKAKAVEERAMESATAVQAALAGEIAQKVEVMADQVFRHVIENRGKIADNYLALKAYCNSMAGDIIDYTTKENGRGLFAVGDLLTVVAAISGTKTKAAEGVGFGDTDVPPVFGGDHIKVSAHLTKTNGLVNEWSKAMSMVRTRWPYGIGHYLLGKVQFAMQNDGILTVGSIADRDGQFVTVNSHALGLANRLSTLEALAAPAAKYQASLEHLNAKLPKKKKVAKKKFYVKFQDKEEWQGD